MAKTFGGNMKRKNTIIGACSLAVIATITGVAVFGTGNSSDNQDKKTAVVVDEVETEEVKPVASGVTNISSVGASSIIDTMDTTNEQLAEVTGDINYFNVGFADVLESCYDYIYDENTSSDELYNYTKQMDIATEVVPEGSIIEGYTNLGISNVTTYLNVRKGPDTSYKVIGKMPGYLQDTRQM